VSKFTHPLDDPKVAAKVLDGLDRVVAELREIRVTVKKAKTKGGADNA
jgi:hypothetical protein